MPDVLLLPVKINIDGIIIIKSVTPKLYLMVSKFFRLFKFPRIKRKINKVIEAVKVLSPAKRIGGIILVVYAIIIGKNEYIKVSPRIKSPPVFSLLILFVTNPV